MPAMPDADSEDGGGREGYTYLPAMPEVEIVVRPGRCANGTADTAVAHGSRLFPVCRSLAELDIDL
jgi:hypothetical protein